MKKQLIKEAKRFQELAGIKKLNENQDSYSPSNNNTDEIWFYPTGPSNPDDIVYELSSYEGGVFDYRKDSLDKPVVIGEETKGEVVENNDLKGFVDMQANKNEDGTWDFEDGDFYYRGWREGEDFIFISNDKMKPLYDAYGGENGFIDYLNNNDWELETGTEEWMDLGEIVGEENMLEYIDFIENTYRVKKYNAALTKTSIRVNGCKKILLTAIFRLQHHGNTLHQFIIKCRTIINGTSNL